MSIQPLSRSSERGQSWLSEIVGQAGRALLVGVGYEILLVIITLLTQLLNIPVTRVSYSALSLIGVLANIFSGLLVAAVLAPLAVRLPYRLVGRAALLFVPLFLIGYLSNLVELIFFSTGVSNIPQGFVIALVQFAGLALPIVWLFPPAAALSTSPGASMRRRSLLSWLWRIALAGFLYAPTYFVFGALIYPVVKPYYGSGSLAMLIVPPVGVWVALEIVRGLLYVVALLPVLAIARRSRWLVVLQVFLVIVTLNSWIPLVINNAVWPLTLRMGHGLEITGDALVQGITIGLLLALTLKKPEREIS